MPLKRKFRRALEARFGCPIDRLSFYPVPSIARDQPVYRIGIHTDVLKKAIAVQSILLTFIVQDTPKTWLLRRIDRMRSFLGMRPNPRISIERAHSMGRMHHALSHSVDLKKSTRRLPATAQLPVRRSRIGLTLSFHGMRLQGVLRGRWNIGAARLPNRQA